MIETGVAPMDRMLGGGIPDGNSVLLVSEPVVESGIFGLQLLSKLPVSKDFLFLLTRTKENLLRSNLAQYGFDANGKFEVVDCYSSLVNESSQSKYVIENPRDFEEVQSVVLRAIDNKQGCFLFVDDVNAFVEYLGEAKAIELVGLLTGRVKALNGVCAFLYTCWGKDTCIKKELEPSFECVVSLNSLEKKVIFGQSFSIERAGWVKTEPITIPFKVIKPGGVRVFIPKILVTGPYNAGKSSFVHSASTRAVSVDRIGTTVALDHGHTDYKGFSIDIFGTPGQERFDPILERLGGEAIGVVVIIDSTDPDSFPRAMDMLSKTNNLSLPYIVVANKADLPGALPVEEIRKRLNLAVSLPIVPVHAENLDAAKALVGKAYCKLNQEDVHAVFDSLFELIFFKK